MVSAAFFVTALCLLALNSANAFRLADWPAKEVTLRGFSWKDCGPSTDPAQIQSLSVSPDPLKLPGNITVNTAFTLSSSSPADVNFELTLEKKIASFFIKVPCIDNVGSCTYKGICADWAKVCPSSFAKYGLPCTCPFPAKSYSVADASFPVTASIPGLASGEYRLTGNLVSTTGEHVVCLQLVVDLA